MTCTVDASVFVAAARETEEHYIISGLTHIIIIP